jgi:hypothetical protein
MSASSFGWCSNIIVSALDPAVASSAGIRWDGRHKPGVMGPLDFASELSLAWHHILQHHFDLRDFAMAGMMSPILRVAASVTLATAAASGPLAAQVARLDLQPREVTMTVGERFEVLAIAEDRSGNILSPTFAWTVADPAVVEVQEDEAIPGVAVIVALSQGETTVEVKVGSLAQKIEVTVEGGALVAGPIGTGVATVILIEPATVYLMPAEDVQLLPRFLKGDGSPAAPEAVTWRSFRPDVATVDPTGLVVGITEGTGLIEASTQSGLSHRVQVQVAQRPWAFAREVIALAPTESDTVEIVVPDQENRPVLPRYFTWQSTNPNVVIVSPLGVVTAIQGGESEIVATGFGEQRRVPVKVHKEVVGWIARAIPGDTITIPVGGTAHFVVVGEAADGTLVPEAPVFWTVGDTTIANYGVVADSTAVGLEVGLTTLTASGEDGVLRRWVLNVVAAGLILDIERAGLDINSQVTIGASFADAAGDPVAPANRVTWTSTNPTGAQVADDGTVTPVGVGRVEIVGTTPWGNADTAIVFVQGRLLFTLTRDGNSDIYAAAPTEPGTMYPVITFPSSQETSPSFSPDGTKIAFVSDGSQTPEIYVANADGSDPRRITQNTAAEDQPVWTPDGRQIVFESTGPSGVPQIWIMNADGNNPRQLTSGEDPNRQPAISPAGQIAFVSDRDGTNDLCLMDADGSNPRNFTASQDMHETMPVWLADTAIVFLQEPDRRNQTLRAIARMNFQREVTTVIEPRPIVSYAITSTGDLVAIVYLAPNATGTMMPRLFLVPQFGGAPAEIARQTDADEFGAPSFRP